MMLSNNKFKVIAAYLGATALCLLILTWVLKLWHADFNIPFVYGGDSLFTGMMIKGVIDNGWYLNNNFVGMPIGTNLYDFPMADNFSFLIIKLLSLFTSNYGLIINLFFLFTFPLTTLTSLYVFRHFKVSYPNSIVGSLLFTFLPYHFLRGESHLFLAAYFMIPLMVMVILWVYLETPLLFRQAGTDKKLVLDLLGTRSIFSILICFLVSSIGVYYAFFACFFLIIVGVSASFHHKRIHHLLVAGMLIVSITIGVVANISPTLIYQYSHGKNAETAARSPFEAEIYGLKINQLLLPVSGHRVAKLAEAKAIYDTHSPLVNENGFSSLGAIGSLGFLILLGMLLCQSKRSSEADLIYRLRDLNISALLLGVVGGFGSVVAIIVPQIRGYNRISIYIAFFSLLTVVLISEELLRRYVKSKRSLCIYYVILGLILFTGIMDQTTSGFIPLYDWYKGEYINDANFVNQIEAKVPRNSMIFQLPYVPFPENPPVQKMGDYELFRGYLHSKTLRWSYGSMKGREGDFWQKQVAEEPLNDMVNTLAFAGFNGIYLDRNGYVDEGVEIETKLAKILDTKPLISANNRLAFYSLVEYNQRFKRQFSVKEWDDRRNQALHPLIFSWKTGFYGLEGTPENNWRWSSAGGELSIYNYSQENKKVIIQMSLTSGFNDFSNLKIEGSSFTENLKINNKGKFFSKTVVISPGTNLIKFSSDANRVDAANDPRDLVFRVVNFKFKEIK